MQHISPSWHCERNTRRGPSHRLKTNLLHFAALLLIALSPRVGWAQTAANVSTFSDLKSKLEDNTTNYIITLTADIAWPVGEYNINVKGTKTLQSDGTRRTISRNSGNPYTGHQSIRTNSIVLWHGSSLTVNNVTFDGKDRPNCASMILVRRAENKNIYEAASLTMTNCTIKNCLLDYGMPLPNESDLGQDQWAISSISGAAINFFPSTKNAASNHRDIRLTNCVFDSNCVTKIVPNTLNTNYVDDINGINALDKRYCNGGALSIADSTGTNSYITGCTFTNNKAAQSGGAICFWETKHPIIVSNCTIGGGSGNPNIAGAIQDGNNTVTNGGEGGGIYCIGGNVSFKNNTRIEHNIAYKSGGGIHIAKSKSFKFLLDEDSCIISNNKVRRYQSTNYDTLSGNGGGIYIEKSNEILGVDIQYTKINNNQAYNGGAIYIDGDVAYPTPIFKYCRIGEKSNSNVAKNEGGGIYVNGSNSQFSNCEINYNYSRIRHGGGIYVNESNATFNTCLIEGNYNDNGGNGGGVYCYVPSSNSFETKFTACNIKNNGISGNTIKTTDGGGAYLNGNVTLEGTTIQGNKATQNGGGVYLENAESTLKSGCLVYGNTASSNGGGIYMQNGKILGGSGANKIYRNTASNNGGGIYYQDGTIQGNNYVYVNTATNNGGGVFVHPKSNTAKTISDLFVGTDDASATDKGNRAVNGGGIYVKCETTSPSITFNACSIVHNKLQSDSTTTINNGGGVFMSDGTDDGDYSYTVNLTGGTIIDDNKALDGGGVYIDQQGHTLTLKLIQTTLSKNEATSKGGGGIYNNKGFVLCDANCSFTFDDNKALDGSGGGIYNFDGRLTLQGTDGGQIFKNNKANNNKGGGMYLGGSSTNGKTILLKNCDVGAINKANGNEAKHGGGIYFEKGDLTLDNTRVSYNKSTNNGGGIFQNCENALTLQGNTKFLENVAGHGGGGLHNATDKTTNITSATFEDNEARSNGGGINNNDGTINITSATFNNNIADKDGGGIYNGGTTSITSATFEDNTAKNGGGLYNAYEKTTSITSATFENNTANNNGGGIYNIGTVEGEDSQVLFDINKATNGHGGGIYNSGTLNLDATGESMPTKTFKGNTAKNGGGIHNDKMVENRTVVPFPPFKVRWQVGSTAQDTLDGTNGYAGRVRVYYAYRTASTTQGANGLDSVVLCYDDGPLGNYAYLRKSNSALTTIYMIVVYTPSTLEAQDYGNPIVNGNLTGKKCLRFFSEQFYGNSGVTAAIYSTNLPSITYPASTSDDLKLVLDTGSYYGRNTGTPLASPDFSIPTPEVIEMGGTANLSNCVIGGSATNANEATAGHGGGIYIEKGSTVTMTVKNEVTHNTAKTHGGGVYKGGTLKVKDMVTVTDNTAGTSGAKAVVPENVYIPPASDDDQTILIIGELGCGSSIGVTKTKKWDDIDNIPYGTQGEHTYQDDDNFEQVRTPIAKVSSNGNQPWALYAFAKNIFFDDKDMYGVWSMNYHKTNTANDYNDQTDYFIETWRCYANNTANDWTEDGSGNVQVKSDKGLAYLSKYVNDIKHDDHSHIFHGKHIDQTADIDLSPHYWEPIGLHTTTLGCENNIYPFSGTYDGHGHTITGAISILPVQAMGLFGYVMNGTVKRTFSIDCDFTLTRDTILNAISNNSTFIEGSTCNGLGGIVGFLHARTTSMTVESTTAMLDRCEAHGKLTQYFVSSPYASSSSKAGEWYADASAIIGGLVGAVVCYGSAGWRDVSLTGITNSFAVTDITGTKAYMGGLVGGMDVKGGNSSNKGTYNLYNSYSKANLTVTTGGTCSVGSLVGVANLGSFAECNINNCYTHNAGEKLVGKTANGSITCSNLYAPQEYNGGEGYVSTYAPTIGADQLGYMYADNLVGTTPLFELLNTNAETLNGNATATENTPGYRTYDRWARPALAYYVDNNGTVEIEKPINGDLPVLLMDNYGDGTNGSVGRGGFTALSTVCNPPVPDQTPSVIGDGYVLQYSGPKRDYSEYGNNPAYNDSEIDGMIERSGVIMIPDVGALDCHFIYGDVSKAPTKDIFANRISIYEHAAITEAGMLGQFDKTHVSITFDNSAGELSNASTLNINNLPELSLPRDWHLLSTPLNNAPLGFDYKNHNAPVLDHTDFDNLNKQYDVEGFYNNPWQNGGTAQPSGHGGTEFGWLGNTANTGTNSLIRYWMKGWANSQSLNHNILDNQGGYTSINLHPDNGWIDGYFPSTFDATLHDFNQGCIQTADENGRYPYGMDFYSWTEPNYHYINFKRNGPNHWHSDEPHVHLDYTPETASNYASPQENVNEEILLAGKGYFASIAEKTLLQSSGQLGTGTNNNKTIGVTCSTYPNTVPLETGWNLVGNPFHAYLDFDEFSENNSGVNDTYIVYNADGFQKENEDEFTYGNGFSYYVAGSSQHGAYASQYLHPHQGFFVKVSSGPTLNFAESQTVLRSQIGTSGSYRDDSRPAYPLVNLFLTSDKGCSDVCVVEFNRPEWGGATKLRDMYSGNGLFYAAHDNGNYAALFATPEAERIPLKFEAKDEAGDTYTIHWNTQNGDFSKLYLIDNLTGVQYDMLRNSSYSFSGKKGDYWSRFYITFEVTGLEEEQDDEDDDDSTGTASTTFAFFDGSQWVVTNEAHGTATLDLIDMQGRVLYSTTVAEGQARIGLPYVAKGMYLMRMTNRNGMFVQKIVVK